MIEPSKTQSQKNKRNKTIGDHLDLTRHNIDIRQKEAEDYVFCLRTVSQQYQGAHVLMMEDDTIPNPGIFPVLHSLLQRRQLERLAYIKLYHPWVYMYYKLEDYFH